MSLVDEIERLRSEHPEPRAKNFREQLERVKEQIHQNDGIPAPRGIDRSGELTPAPRPTILRTSVS